MVGRWGFEYFYGFIGTFNEVIILNGMAAIETPEMMAARVDEFGTPTAYNHYASSWAHAMCTPYQWTKQIASHLGGTRNGTIVHWPNGFAARGQMRAQFHHVIDVAPTVLEAAGLPEPDFVNGIQQRPMEGVSMRYCLDDDTWELYDLTTDWTQARDLATRRDRSRRRC